MSTHIQIARTQGAKAGFRHYLAQHTPTAAARRAEIRSAGNSKAQFEAYCAIFGSQFGPVNGNGAVRAEEQREEVRENGAVAELRRLAAKLGVRVVTDESPVENDTEDEAEVIVATRISWPMCMAVKKAVEREGKSFEITGKTGGKGTGKPADYAIKVAGRKQTPAQASAIIAKAKAA
jgi:hypothetical protein